MITKHADVLPQFIIELIEVIGETAATIIVEQRGGVPLCVPAKVSKDHWLHGAIGQHAFEQLVDRYQREEIWIPRCAAALHKIKQEQIVRESENTSTTELARQYGYTDRYIRMIKARAKNTQPDPQTDLFETEN